MRRLKLELKQTMDMYSNACKEALSAKKKVWPKYGISCRDVNSLPSYFRGSNPQWMFVFK